MASPKIQHFSPSTAPSPSDEETCVRAMQLVFLSVLPMALTSAIELNVFEIIAKAGPGAYLSPGEISAQLPMRHSDTPDRLDRVLSVLASHDVLTCSVEADSDGKVGRKYGAAPVVRFFTRSEDGASLAPMAIMLNSKYSMERWYHMKDAIMDGEIPFNKAHGMSPFEYYSKESHINWVFNDAMASSTAIAMKGILEAYKGFDNVNLLIDVGGGLGGTLELIVKKHPHIKGINFDLPHVISNAPAIPGVKHISGDMFQSVPAGADAILLKWLLHNWSDEQCVKILKNCCEALGDNGKVIIMEHCLLEYPERTDEAQYAFMADLNMMSSLPGKERTAKEFEAMAKKVGFSKIEIACSYAAFYVLEFYK